MSALRPNVRIVHPFASRSRRMIAPKRTASLSNVLLRVIVRLLHRPATAIHQPMDRTHPIAGLANQLAERKKT
jgi:hypothetical protein